MKILAFIILTIGLAGCVDTQTKDSYAAYIKLQQDQADAATAQRAKLESDLTAQAAACKDDACKIAIAGFRALASAGGGSQLASIAPPPVQPTGWDRAIQLLGVLSPFAADVVQYKSVVESNKTSRYEAQENAAVQIANTNAWAGALTGVASTPSTYIGGNYTNIGGDQVGGDKITNSGTYNTGSGARFNSPNTTTNTGGAGGNCTSGSSGAGGSSSAAGNGAASGAAGAVSCNGGSP